MATFTVLDSISKSDTFPITYDYSAEYNCGILSLEISSAWSNQMLLELPCINFKILKSDGTLFRTFSINMSTVNTDLNTGISAAKPYIIPFYDIPKSGSFHITPMFDKNAIAAHNEMERNGIVNSINTTNKGVVTADDIDIWTNTDVFDITIEFSNDNISSGGAGGGGGDTPTLIDKNITANGTYLASNDDADGYSSVTVDVPSGGGGTTKKDVNFYDYDGTIVNSYTAEEFANLNAMPENPTHNGLTAQGWNYTLENAKTYVSSYGKLDIGQMYITSDGKTRIYIELHDGRLEPVLGLGINGSVDVDWGDGTDHDTMTGTNVSTNISKQHIYATEGDYVITLTVTGSIQLNGTSNYSRLLTKQSGGQNTNRVYSNSLTRIEVGSGVTSIGDYAFHSCFSLSSITLPQSVTSIGYEAFYCCYSLSSITLPQYMTSIGNYAFHSCSSLSSITLPQSVTSIGIIVFYYCRSLSSVTFPQGVTSIQAFYYCQSLSSVTLPQSVTLIDTSAFEGCYTLSSITIPQGVTSIGGKVFQDNYGLGKIVFKNSTPPTVSSSTAFSGIPTDCIIYVPEGSLSTYTSAQNYPSSSTYTYVEY